MAENKTKSSQLSVESYFASIADKARWADCEKLSALMEVELSRK